jgi:hypothetical protein
MSVTKIVQKLNKKQAEKLACFCADAAAEIGKEGYACCLAKKAAQRATDTILANTLYGSFAFLAASAAIYTAYYAENKSLFAGNTMADKIIKFGYNLIKEDVHEQKKGSTDGTETRNTVAKTTTHYFS